MVGISLYRGNLHRVPDIPRRWLMPRHNISLKNFKSLLARRSKALSQTAATVTTFSNPNHHPNSDSSGQNEALAVNGSSLVSHLEAVKVHNNGEGPSGQEEDRTEPEAVGNSMNKPGVGSDLSIDSNIDVLERASEPVDGGTTSMEKQTEPVTEKVELLHDRQKRKREVEHKLEVLNAKKHNLVLVLKQILYAEEELRRNSMQELTMCPAVPPQADETNNSNSMIRHITPRMGLEANLGDAEGAENDDLSNWNIHACQVRRTSSMSPSLESPLRKTPSVQQNMVSLSRASLGAASSPSRFTLSGHQGTMNIPAVSVNGKNYIASSPSPATCGVTSVFRDAVHGAKSFS